MVRKCLYHWWVYGEPHIRIREMVNVVKRKPGKAWRGITEKQPCSKDSRRVFKDYWKGSHSKWIPKSSWGKSPLLQWGETDLVSYRLLQGEEFERTSRERQMLFIWLVIIYEFFCYKAWAHNTVSSACHTYTWKTQAENTLGYVGLGKAWQQT